MDIHFYLRTKWLSISYSIIFHFLFISLTIFFGFKIIEHEGSNFASGLNSGLEPARVSFAQPSQIPSLADQSRSLSDSSPVIDQIPQMAQPKTLVPQKTSKALPAISQVPISSPTSIIDKKEKALTSKESIETTDNEGTDISESQEVNSYSNTGTVSSAFSGFARRNSGSIQSLYSRRPQAINSYYRSGVPSANNSTGSYGQTGQKPKRITSDMLANAYNKAFNNTSNITNNRNSGPNSGQINLDSRIEELNFDFYYEKINKSFIKAARHFKKHVNFKDAMYHIVTIDLTVNEDNRTFNLQQDQLTGIEEIDNCIIDFIKSVDLPPVPKKLKGQTITRTITFKMNCDKGNSVVYFVPA